MKSMVLYSPVYTYIPNIMQLHINKQPTAPARLNGVHKVRFLGERNRAMVKSSHFIVVLDTFIDTI